jgi:phosphinothricin acetyltransferase
MDYALRAMADGDWEEVRRIYLAGIATGCATFETEAPAWTAWDQGHRKSCRLVAAADGCLLGWAALSAVSSRPVYRGVAEVSLYVDAPARGQGVGSALLEKLICVSEAEGFWTLQAGIFASNAASLALHRKHDFREVGRREKIGQLQGLWHDTILLERRSKIL